MPYPLIVCASLVQNPLNLGGLCRTCEALGVGTLLLPQLAVTESWAFRKVSASAYKWQAMAACPPEQLVDWLTQQRYQGCRIVGLTSRGAVQDLSTYRFVEKSVLVLGRELTGLSSAVEAVCDDAIAIAQLGQVESLNVQTAAAIAIYEYGRQQMARQP